MFILNGSQSAQTLYYFYNIVYSQSRAITLTTVANVIFLGVLHVSTENCDPIFVLLHGLVIVVLLHLHKQYTQ